MLNQAFAQGAEVELARPSSAAGCCSIPAYTYTSTEILSDPAPIDSQYNPGQPLLRRPNTPPPRCCLISAGRWGSNLSWKASVGRRPDDDFDGFQHLPRRRLTFAAIFGGWYTINSRITAYAKSRTLSDRRYNEVVRLFPRSPSNFRAGFRFPHRRRINRRG